MIKEEIIRNVSLKLIIINVIVILSEKYILFIILFNKQKKKYIQKICINIYIYI